MRFAILAMLCAAPITLPPALAAEGDPEPKKVAVLTVSGQLPESPGGTGLFGDLGGNLADLVRRLDAASQDDDVEAVLLRIRSPSAGRGKVSEIQQAIQRVRASGKKVVAQLDSADMPGYQLAVSCNEIVMPESGTLTIPGVRAEFTFYKSLFEKVGLRADMMQVGDFKGSAEPYTRDTLSDEFRAQFEKLLDDFFDQLVTNIAEKRNLQSEEVRRLIDVGMFTSDAARQAGLIDHVLYTDQLEQHLKKSLEVEEIAFQQNYARRKVDNDFSGMVGIMKFLEALLGTKSSGRASKRSKLAVIYASGTIAMGESGVSLTGGAVVGGRTLVKAIRTAADDDTVVAIVLRVDSPGGSALASDLIWRAIKQCEKPVIASLGDKAASGGYYISMGCDKIIAEPGTLTGSIGVLGGKISASGLFDKLGVNTEVISRGKNSGILSLNRAFSDTEREVWMDMMQEVYRQFVAKAAQGRDMEPAALQELAGGRVWTGRQAVENGLVDQLGTMHDAVQAAREAAGVGPDDKLEILTLPKPVSFLEQLLATDATLMQMLLTKAEQIGVPAPLRQQLLWAELLQQEPVLLSAPFFLKLE